MRNFFVLFLAGAVFSSCSSSVKIGRSARQFLLQDTALQTAHVGISIYEPATGKRWYDYQGDKYFVPASNVKLVTCYAAMKYLGDSLVGARYIVDNDGAIELFPSGDPTFLHSDFPYQPVFEKLKQYPVLRWDITEWKEKHWGSGWSWDDYDADYMAERSPFPVYGNVTRAFVEGSTLLFQPVQKVIWLDTNVINAGIVASVASDPKAIVSGKFEVTRAIDQNVFYVKHSAGSFKTTYFPMHMNEQFASALLKDTLHLSNVSPFSVASGFTYQQTKTIIHSQPTDSLLRPMMHRSDNFFAEQALLMVSNERLGFMNDEKIIDTLLKTDLKDLPQKPRWVDGSGLSRYNLFTPQDFVSILGKMKTEFGWARLKTILPTGNEGTFKNYFTTDSTAFYAKTGSLSGVIALSGFLTTMGGRELIFSVLVNNHQASSTAVRRAVERFLQNLRRAY